MGIHREIVTNVLNSDIVVTEFESSRVHFQTDSLKKGMNPLYRSSYEVNSGTPVFLQGWLLHQIMHEGRYIIKQRNRTKLLRIA